jgi:hypothetical protein
LWHPSVFAFNFPFSSLHSPSFYLNFHPSLGRKSFLGPFADPTRANPTLDN